MILALLSILAGPALGGGDLLAIKVGRAETVSQGVIEHAVILVENGKIVEIGQDLPIERGIPVLDRPEWIATPGLINPYTRIGERRNAGRAFEPQDRPLVEIDPRDDHWHELLELGVTTLGYYPAGGGIPGQAIVLRPHGDTLAEMLVRDSAYIKIELEASAASKKALRKAFEDVDGYDEKVAKEREKWEKAREKEERDSKKKKKDEKDEKDEEKDEGDKDGVALPDDDEKEGVPKVFTPTPPDAKVQPFIDLRAKSLTAMMCIGKAADYLHLLDVIEREEDVQWFLQFSLAHDRDFYEVAERIGERELLVVTEPELTLQVNRLRVRNVPAELVEAGARVALLPRSDSVPGHGDWLVDVGRLIADGLPREAALAAVTLEGARALGLDAELGSLDRDKTANIVFWSADPFEPDARVRAVMLEGDLVIGDER